MTATAAATLARAAREGTRGMATTTLTAHSHAMEARALARLRDTKACGHALSQTMREFERADQGNDPPWFQYFTESELSAELGHCMRDLGRPVDAVQHAGNLCPLPGSSPAATSSPSSSPTPTWPQATSTRPVPWCSTR
jgi:hypothetical protein